MSRWVTFHHGEEVFSGSGFSSEVNFAISININTFNPSLGWFVEKFTFEVGMLITGVSSIVIVEMNDLVFWNTSLLEDLVSMASISLMSIVSESGRSSNNDTPMVRISVDLSLSNSNCSESSEFHLKKFFVFLNYNFIFNRSYK